MMRWFIELNAYLLLTSTVLLGFAPGIRSMNQALTCLYRVVDKKNYIFTEDPLVAKGDPINPTYTIQSKGDTYNDLLGDNRGVYYGITQDLKFHTLENTGGLVFKTTSVRTELDGKKHLMYFVKIDGSGELTDRMDVIANFLDDDTDINAYRLYMNITNYEFSGWTGYVSRDAESNGKLVQQIQEKTPGEYIFDIKFDVYKWDESNNTLTLEEAFSARQTYNDEQAKTLYHVVGLPKDANLALMDGFLYCLAKDDFIKNAAYKIVGSGNSIIFDKLKNITTSLEGKIFLKTFAGYPRKLKTMIPVTVPYPVIDTDHTYQIAIHNHRALDPGQRYIVSASSEDRKYDSMQSVTLHLTGDNLYVVKANARMDIVLHQRGPAGELKLAGAGLPIAVIGTDCKIQGVSAKDVEYYRTPGLIFTIRPKDGYSVNLHFDQAVPMFGDLVEIHFKETNAAFESIPIFVEESQALLIIYWNNKILWRVIVDWKENTRKGMYRLRPNSCIDDTLSDILESKYTELKFSLTKPNEKGDVYGSAAKEVIYVSFNQDSRFIVITPTDIKATHAAAQFLRQHSQTRIRRHGAPAPLPPSPLREVGGPSSPVPVPVPRYLHSGPLLSRSTTG